MARESNPKFSPDGKSLTFTNDRSRTNQLYLVNLPWTNLEQKTFHSEGCSLEQWCSDGRLIISGKRDHFWKNAQRLFFIQERSNSQEDLIFDAHSECGKLSPNGKSILFQRDGSAWWRKGYKASKAGKIWHYLIEKGSFKMLVDETTDCRSRIWHPNNIHFYYISSKSGSPNLWKKNLINGN